MLQDSIRLGQFEKRRSAVTSTQTHMPPFAGVLDACVLFPAALRDTLLRVADADLYRVHWTDKILDEVQRNIVSARHMSEEKAQRLIHTMSSYFPDASVVQYTDLIDAMPNHPKDRHILAAAVVVGAQVIVTFNLKHFPQDMLAPLHIEAQSPDGFLTHLFHLAPSRMTEILLEQARFLRNPPKTALDVLERLEKHAPTFTALVLKELELSTQA
jgi:predicted nucleic acid-binding protein